MMLGLMAALGVGTDGFVLVAAATIQFEDMVDIDTHCTLCVGNSVSK